AEWREYREEGATILDMGTEWTSLRWRQRPQPRGIAVLAGGGVVVRTRPRCCGTACRPRHPLDGPRNLHRAGSPLESSTGRRGQVLHPATVRSGTVGMFCSVPGSGPDGVTGQLCAEDADALSG